MRCKLSLIYCWILFSFDIDLSLNIDILIFLMKTLVENYDFKLLESLIKLGIAFQYYFDEFHTSHIYAINYCKVIIIAQSYLSISTNMILF